MKNIFLFLLINISSNLLSQSLFERGNYVIDLPEKNWIEGAKKISVFLIKNLQDTIIQSVSYPESRPIKNRILRATKGASIEEIINFKLLMKKTQFTEQKIVAMLKQHEQGLRAVDIARANGISEKTLYRWKSKYGGMDIKELKRVKELEAENSKLKRMYADLALMNEALKDVIEKKL